MKVLMLKNKVGSNDGLKVISFLEGNTYDVPSEMSEELASSFIFSHSAKEVKAEKFNPVEATKVEKVETKKEAPKKKPGKAKKDKD